MKRELTKEEVDDLFNFCYFNEVPYYDVQIEVVDHLASAIEELWETNPDLDFDNAVYLASQQLGGQAGLVIIKQEKEKALRKEYRLMVWRIVVEFYRFPKIILTAAVSLIIFFSLKNIQNDAWILSPLIFSVSAFSLYFLYFYFPKHIKIKSDGAAFLLNEVLQNRIAYKTLLVGGYFFGISTRLVHLSSVESIVFSILFSLYLVLLYADCVVLPKKVKKHFYDQFPQFVKA